MSFDENSISQLIVFCFNSYNLGVRGYLRTLVYTLGLPGYLSGYILWGYSGTYLGIPGVGHTILPVGYILEYDKKTSTRFSTLAPQRMYLRLNTCLHPRGRLQHWDEYRPCDTRVIRYNEYRYL